MGSEERGFELEEGEVGAGGGGEGTWAAEAKGFVVDIEREGEQERVVVEDDVNVGHG